MPRKKRSFISRTRSSRIRRKVPRHEHGDRRCFRPVGRQPSPAQFFGLRCVHRSARHDSLYARRGGCAGGAVAVVTHMPIKGGVKEKAEKGDEAEGLDGVVKGGGVVVA